MELNELAMHVDNYVRAREDRLAADKLAADLKSAENELMNTILGAMIDSDMNMVGGAVKKVTRRKSTAPVVEDWDAVRKYILETGHTNLLHKRIAAGTYKELVEDGEEIPGTHLVEVNKLTVSKI